MQLSTTITLAGPGRVEWAVRDERWQPGAACRQKHVHAAGHIAYSVASTQAERNEAQATAETRAAAAIADLRRRGYGRHEAAKHLAACER